jgi:hypothetical protein
MKHASLQREPPALEEGFDAIYTDAQLERLELDELSSLL